MIVKNEEDVLKRCLDCASRFADEIIIADTGSSDSTKEIAKKFTDKVFDFEWIEDFAAARNFAFSKAAMDYCMWLDADDVIDDENISKIIALKSSLDPKTDIVKMKYNTGFDADGNVTFSYYRERLFKRTAGFLWEGAVHEVIAPRGVSFLSDIAVCHKKLHPSDGSRNLRIYEHQLKKGAVLSPRDQFYYARELFYHDRTDRAIEILESFVTEKRGWIENLIEACKLLSKCYLKKNDSQSALRSLFYSLEFDSPRAEISCDIGDLFLTNEQYAPAIFWYETAADCIRNDASGAFVLPDCYDYYPYIQLCVCYDRLGNFKQAQICNEKAGRIKPKSRAYLYNKDYYLRSGL